jgi:hypothetical protein
MPNSELSLALLFDGGAAGDRSAVDVYADAIQQARAFKKLVTSARLVLPQTQWHAAAEEIARRLRELLDVPLPRLLVNGWALRSEMKSYCDRQKYPPDRSTTVSLAKHSITWSLKPKVQVRMNNVPVGELPFTLEAKATLDAAVLTIRDGRVRALNTGSIALVGSVMLEDHEIFKSPESKTAIPGGISFGEGFSLCRTEEPTNTSRPTRSV